jgi:ATP-dependent exoDNAse (exonuclease V) beta subunit
MPDKYQVTWWDPRALRLGVESTFGLRRDDLIVKDGDMFAVEDRLAEYETWRDAKADVVARAGSPTVRFVTATAWAAEAAQQGIDTVLASDIEVVELAGSANRPRGPRFGSLVHAVLATIPLDAADEAVERAAATCGRLLKDVTSEEIHAAGVVVCGVLRHDLAARARRSATLRRETPVTWMQKDGTLIEGVLDLAFDEGERTIVVDFKTDHELAAGETRYRAQLQQYVNAVSSATGRPAAGVLFRV